MICTPCRLGQHCGPPGVPGPCGTCQHHPSGRLTDPPAPLQPEPVRPDLPAPSVPAADAEPLFITMLSDWQREHRAGHFTRAASIRRRLITYMERMG